MNLLTSKAKRFRIPNHTAARATARTRGLPHRAAAVTFLADHLAEGAVSLPPSYPLDTPWGIEHDIVMRQSGLSFWQAWEGVIIEWLHDGNVEPLADWFAHGLAPPRKVLQYFAAMLGPDTKDHLDIVPYRICLHRRSQTHGRPRRQDQHATLVERLNAGDVSLLRLVLIGEEPPAAPVLQHLAMMLAPREETEAEIPYEFVVKHRREGLQPKRKDRRIKMRDVLVADNFAHQLAERGRGSYKVIQHELAQKTGSSEEAVRKIHARYYGKKNRTMLP